MLDKLKRIADADENETRCIEYECQRCESRFEMQRQVCPECGGCHIDRPDW